MRKFLLGAVLTLITLNASAAPRGSRMQSDNCFPFMPKAKTALTKTTVRTGGSPLKASASQTLPTSDESGYLNGPHDAVWFYTMEYTGETVDHGSYSEQLINGFILTVYNDKFEEVGKVEDTFELSGIQTKIAQFSIGPDVTQKFFNFDNNYEVMIGVAFNTSVYVNENYTYVYSIGKNDPIATFDGYYCSAINTATDAWSENFWITFMTEEETETPEVNGILNSADYCFRTYKKAGYSGMGDPVLETRFPAICLSGADAMPFLANSHEGVPYFAVSYLKYSWYEDPYDYNNENPTAGNSLIVDIYSPASAWASTVDKYCTTTFAMNTTAEDLYYLYFGNFGYDTDLDFAVNGDGTPALYITRAHTQQGGDTFLYDYEVYNAADKGQTAEGVKKFTLAEGVNGGTFMNDISGFAPQVMFISTGVGGYYAFSFVDITTGKLEYELDPYVDPSNTNVSLTVNTNRIPWNGRYVYYAPQNNGVSDESGNVKTSVIFVDPETASIVKTDELNLGTGVEYAQVYSGADTFDPFIFNLDDSREYMALVKRRAADGVGTVEELMVISADPGKGAILSVGPDEAKGTLANVYFANLNGEKPKLVVVYQNTGNWKTTLDTYDLPLTGFEKGDGSVNNPYEISTAGGLKHISANPAAHYAVVKDFDAEGYTLSQQNFDFKGSLDGRDHVISNLNIDGYSIIPSMTRDTEAADDTPDARLVNLNFVNPVFTTTKDDQGLLLGRMSGGLVENIHVYDGKITAAEGVGGLVGQGCLYGKIQGCSFQGDIDGGDGSVGGIVINTMTSASVRACAFSGDITGAQFVGGIIGSTYGNAGVTADCHVNANIKGKNTIGGIVGNSARAVIRNCHVQGTLEATEAGRWGGGPKLGGITGQLDRDFGSESGEGENEGDDTETEAVIHGCYVNLSAMTYSGSATEENYAGQNDTMHRIVGWSSVNDYPEETGYDEVKDEPIYGDPAPAETALADNYAVATLSAGSASVEMSKTSTEGASVKADETGIDFFTALGWLYGEDIDNPWNPAGDPKCPILYFEDQRPDDSGIEEIENTGRFDDAQNMVRFDGVNVYADGCAIEVFSTTGARVLTGYGEVSLNSLQGGVYIVSAVNAEGKRSALKVSVR